jgi:hypothetical protein
MPCPNAFPAPTRSPAATLVDDLDSCCLSGSGDAHGDGVGRFGIGNSGFDERRELPPEQHRIGEHAQARHLDVDDPPGKERLELVERSPKLFQESTDVNDI